MRYAHSPLVQVGFAREAGSDSTGSEPNLYPAENNLALARDELIGIGETRTVYCEYGLVLSGSLHRANVHAHRRAPTHLFRGTADPRASVWGVLLEGATSRDVPRQRQRRR